LLLDAHLSVKSMMQYDQCMHNTVCNQNIEQILKALRNHNAGILGNRILKSHVHLAYYSVESLVSSWDSPQIELDRDHRCRRSVPLQTDPMLRIEWFQTNLSSQRRARLGCSCRTVLHRQIRKGLAWHETKLFALHSRGELGRSLDRCP
jgi:hypothetical protein